MLWKIDYSELCFEKKRHSITSLGSNVVRAYSMASDLVRMHPCNDALINPFKFIHSSICSSITPSAPTDRPSVHHPAIHPFHHPTIRSSIHPIIHPSLQSTLGASQPRTWDLSLGQAKSQGKGPRKEVDIHPFCAYPFICASN